MAALSSHDLVMDHLECHVCMEFMHPPIYQCPNGHTLCTTCKQDPSNQLQLCPTCRVYMGDIRALSLEQIAATFRFPCKHQDMGCSATLKYGDKRKHEEECRHRPYGCPYTRTPCVVSGDVQTLVAHLISDHGSEFGDGCEIDGVCTHLNPCNGEITSAIVSVHNCFYENFCLQFEAFHSPVEIVYMAFLTFIGNEDDAKNYRYSLEIYSDTHRMLWQGVPRSVREGITKIRESLDGLVIHRTLAQTFAEVNSNEVLKLRVKGLIWRA